MARLIPVVDPADPRLADYAGLRDVELRRRVEVARGLFLAEGATVLRRAVAAGYPVRSFLLAERFVEPLGEVLDAAPDAPCFVGRPEVVEAVTGYQVHRGVLASMQRRPLAPVAELLAAARRVAVFEDIVDVTNLGAAFRSAAALDVDAVLVTPRCADPLYRRSVKVSMGAVFQVPWTRIPWPDGVQVLREHGFVTAALALSDTSLTLDELAARGDLRLALVFGTEGDGLRRSTLARVDHIVRIPMSGGVDSLNVAAAAAVAFYATRPAPS